MSSIPDSTASIVATAKDLLSALSKDARILTDSRSDEFTQSIKRWSDRDIKTPSAIVKPATEEDVVKIVSRATTHKVPFVIKGGGNSLWSTIGPNGWIIDTGLLTKISLNTREKTATIQAGVLTKQLNEVVAKAGFYIQSANSANVGHIGFFLGGGSTWFAGMHGMAVDNLISTRVITATKGLVVASEAENSDLFWALKGAGQFFGLVTEVTVRVFEWEQDITAWTCLFLPSQVKEVAEMLKKHLESEEVARSPAMAAVMAPPGQTKPMILVNIMNFRPKSEADAIVAPLLALKPVQKTTKTIAFVNITDAAEALNKQSGFKTQISCGMRNFDESILEKGLESWTKLVDEHPSASSSFFMYNLMSFVTSTDEVAANAEVKNTEEFLQLCQASQKEDEKSLFPNHTRGHSLEQRYRGEWRGKKLRELKSVWDPEGVFTREFL